MQSCVKVRTIKMKRHMSMFFLAILHLLIYLTCLLLQIYLQAHTSTVTIKYFWLLVSYVLCLLAELSRLLVQKDIR